MKRIGAACALLIAAAYLYNPALNSAGLQVGDARVESASAMLAEHGLHDLEGRFLPVFVHGPDETWLPPVPVYACVLVRSVAPRAKNPCGYAAAIAGGIDVALAFILAAQLFGGVALPFLAGLLVLVSPAHLMLSRTAGVDGVWPLPFLLGSFIGVAAFVVHDRPRPWVLAVAAAALAGSAYCQPSAPLMVTIVGLAGVLMLSRSAPRRLGDLWPTGVAVLVVLLPWLSWFARYPSTYASTLGGWVLHAAHIRNPADWVRASLNWHVLSLRVHVYWDFFNPRHLFLNDSMPGLAGVFLFPVYILLACGAIKLLQRGTADEQVTRSLLRAVLACFVAAPLAAAAFNEPRAIERALVVVPLGVLLAMHGVRTLWWANRRASRLAVIVLLAAAPVQFGVARLRI